MKFKLLDRNVLPLITGLALVLLFYAAFFWQNKTIKNKAVELAVPYETGSVQVNSWIDNLDSVPKLSEKQLSVLKTINKLILKRKKHYKITADYFLGNYYASILITLFTTVLGGIVIFIIAFKGWANTNMYVKSIFLALFFSAAFWGFFPEVFNQKDNYETNIKRYLEYDRLQLILFSYLSTGGNVSLIGNPHPDSVITSLNKRILNMDDIIISIENIDQDMSEIANEIGRNFGK